MSNIASRPRRAVASLRRRGRTQLRRLSTAVREGEATGLARQVRAANLTFLDEQALVDLWLRARDVDRRGIPGVIVEAGCALGGSAVVLAAAKRPERPLHVFDVFGQIPPPGERDGDDVHERYRTIAEGRAEGHGGETYYGYLPDLKDRVAATFAEYGHPPEESNIRLVQGLFEDTIRPDGPIALGHVDGDWYESVRTCLDRMWPALSPGGALVVDDYDAWSGCRTAVDEWRAGRTDVRLERHARLHLVKG